MKDIFTTTKSLNFDDISGNGKKFKDLIKDLVQTQIELAKLEKQSKKNTAEWVNQFKAVAELTETNKGLNAETLILSYNIELASKAYHNTVKNGEHFFKNAELFSENAENKTKKENDRLKETLNALEGTTRSFETVFGLLSKWTGDSENGVSRFFKNIKDSFGILEEMLNFVEAIKNISDSIKTIEIGAGASKAGSGGNFFKSIFSLFSLFFADGGYVKGAGSGKSDSIPAYLSNGEFVINANSTKQYLPLLELINGNRKSVGIGFANGGIVNMQRQNDRPIYITATMDGITFLKTNYPKYKSWKQSIRI